MRQEEKKNGFDLDITSGSRSKAELDKVSNRKGLRLGKRQQNYLPIGGHVESLTYVLPATPQDDHRKLSSQIFYLHLSYYHTMSNPPQENYINTEQEQQQKNPKLMLVLLLLA